MIFRHLCLLKWFKFKSLTKSDLEQCWLWCHCNIYIPI